MNWKVFRQGAINAVLSYAYVVVVGLFLSRASHIFGPKDSWLTPVAVLMLLVFSASLMGILVFGRPVLWYIDGKKQLALKLLGYTMVVLLVLMILTFAALLFVR